MCSGPKAQKTKITNFALLVVVPMGAPTRDVEVPASLDNFSSMQTHAMVFNFQIADTPLRLRKWLLLNLDMYSMTLKMPNGVAIVVDDEDVEAVFVLPRGPKVIIDRAKHEKSVILNSWRESFEKVDYAITPAENRYVHQHVIPNLEDTLEVANLNWCPYVIHSLIVTQAAWMSRKTQKFIGPLLFLTVLYVDRVRSGGCTPSRMLPSFVGCDSTMLKEREEWEITSGGFGRGEVLELVRPMKKVVINENNESVVDENKKEEKRDFRV
nr:uncharacterized protein LOC109179738 isoform X2 [Ipomoea batatas]